MTWKTEVMGVITDHWSIGQEFTLQELYQYVDSLAEFYPRNRNLRAKVRQTLQSLRRERTIELVRGVGKYRRRA
jgi:hypothetical protein